MCKETLHSDQSILTLLCGLHSLSLLFPQNGYKDFARRHV